MYLNRVNLYPEKKNLFPNAMGEEVTVATCTTQNNLPCKTASTVFVLISLL